MRGFVHSSYPAGCYALVVLVVIMKLFVLVTRCWFVDCMGLFWERGCIGFLLLALIGWAVLAAVKLPLNWLLLNMTLCCCDCDVCLLS